MNIPAIGLGLTFLNSTVWHPGLLFHSGASGVWFDPGDYSTVFQDAAGTIPALPGDPVGLILDKSGGGHHASQSSASLRPTLNTDGVKSWLQFSGVASHLHGAYASPQSQLPLSINAAYQRTGTTSMWQSLYVDGYSGGSSIVVNGVPNLNQRAITTQLGMHDAWRNDVGVFVEQGAFATNTDWVASCRRTGGSATGYGGTLQVTAQRSGAASLVSAGTQTWDSGSSSQFTVGTQDTDGSDTQALQGRIYQLIVVHRTVSDAEQAVIASYLSRRINL